MSGPPPITAARRRVLEHLKQGGPSEVATMAGALGLTDVAVRQHLAALEEIGLVDAAAAPPGGPPRGRGRPPGVWQLTPAAAALFPDRHGDLAAGLIEAIRVTAGEEVLHRIVEVRARDQVKLYRGLAPPNASLRRRVEALAEQRSAEGYMASVEQERPGQYLLIEHHCPICDAARVCQGLCRSELEVFRRSLGRTAHVERIEHLLSEGRRCVYRITKRPARRSAR